MNQAWQRSSFLGFLACVVSAGLTAGCSGDTNTTVEQDPLVIEAYIEGTVIDGITRAPLAGATVKAPGVSGASGTFTTDETGFYSLAVPGVGSHTLFVEADGYARAKYTVNAQTEPGAAGQIRVTAVRNSQLYPTNATLKGRVTSGGNRDLIAGASVLVQFTDSTDPIEDAALVVTGKTDKSGMFTLSNLPSGSPQTRVSVLPVDLDKNGTPDTATYSALVTGGVGGGSLTPGGENFMDIVVDQFIADKVLWTNLDDGATVAEDATLEITYAQPMLDTFDATTVTLREGGAEISIDQSWTSNVTLRIQPKEPLLAGHSYTLTVQAVSAAGSSVSYTKAFSVTSGDAPTAAVTGTTLVDAEPLAWNAKTFSVAWDGIPGVDSYRVLARNSQLQQSWVVLFEGAVSQFERPRVRVTLPDVFDTFPSEDAFSATGFATSVDFAVQAFNGKNDGPFQAPAEMASLSDTHCPRITVTSQGTTDNTAGTEPIRAKYLMTSEGGEPIADNPAPVFVFAVGLGALDTTLLDGKKPTFRRVRADQFEVSFAVPKGSSGAADEVTVDLSKVTDTSGNAPDGSLLCPDVAKLISN